MKFARGDVVKHIKSGGVYVIDLLARMESNAEPVYAYSLICDRQVVWIRPATQMEDGRFVLCHATEIKAGDASVHKHP